MHPSCPTTKAGEPLAGMATGERLSALTAGLSISMITRL
jgi:hypothetical protein